MEVAGRLALHAEINMKNEIEECIDVLVESEPMFKRAGDLALKLRSTASSRNKYQSGIKGIDIVTEADLAVQEAILSELAKTKLIECQLIAEEDTTTVAKFKGMNVLS